MKILTHAQTGGGKEDNVIIPVLEHVEEHLKDSIKGKDYGGEMNNFVIYIFSVYSNNQENIDYAKPSHKVERIKDYYGDNKWIKSIVFALPFNPDLVSKMKCEKFRVLLCNTILERLEDPQMKILKAFDYEAFKHDVAKEVIFYRDNIPFKQL